MKYKNIFIILLHYKVQILLFDWYESFYVFEHHITYSFSKHECLITSRIKCSIEFEHPPLRNLKIPHSSQTIDVAIYKNPNENITIKHQIHHLEKQLHQYQPQYHRKTII